ncbi:Transcriptional regulator (fragment) [Paraburkholderia piptadeniae]|uniref:Transcriptional regulator n=1 Tax=Paraburkholderia piptadeniae TaxID=1701573 RepID=A0A1N7SVR6_9BURK
MRDASVAALPVHCVADDIRNRRLVWLFADSHLQNTSVFAVYSCRHRVDAKIKTFIDFLTPHFRQMPDSILQDEHKDETPGRLTRAVENV